MNISIHLYNVYPPSRGVSARLNCGSDARWDTKRKKGKEEGQNTKNFTHIQQKWG